MPSKKYETVLIEKEDGVTWLREGLRAQGVALRDV